MKPEEQAWRDLRSHASRQLRSGFADRVLRAANGPAPAAWAELRAQGAAQLRPGFAERVLRAARNLPGVPSLLEQFAFSLGTAALCVVATLAFHSHRVDRENARNLERWQQIAAAVHEADPRL